MRRPGFSWDFSINTGNVTNVRVSKTGDFWDDFLGGWAGAKNRYILFLKKYDNQKIFFFGV